MKTHPPMLSLYIQLVLEGRAPADVYREAIALLPQELPSGKARTQAVVDDIGRLWAIAQTLAGHGDDRRTGPEPQRVHGGDGPIRGLGTATCSKESR